MLVALVVLSVVCWLLNGRRQILLAELGSVRAERDSCVTHLKQVIEVRERLAGKMVAFGKLVSPDGFKVDAAGDVDLEANYQAAVLSLRVRCKQMEERLRGFDSPTGLVVLAFARVMEQMLEKNRHKGNREGWQNEQPSDLVEHMFKEAAEVNDEVTAFLAKLREEVGPVMKNLQGLELQVLIQKILHECADLANLAMMVADRCGGLEVAAPVLLPSEEFSQPWLLNQPARVTWADGEPVKIQFKEGRAQVVLMPTVEELLRAFRMGEYRITIGEYNQLVEAMQSRATKAQ